MRGSICALVLLSLLIVPSINWLLERSPSESRSDNNTLSHSHLKWEVLSRTETILTHKGNLWYMLAARWGYQLTIAASVAGATH